MLITWLLLLFLNGSLASNSTALVSWQLEGNGRSTWDILWPCLTTIFACTWTILHFGVWPRNISNRRIWLSQLRTAILAILAPEVIFLIAAEELTDVKRVRELCNTAQRERDGEAEPKSWLSMHTRPLEQAQAPKQHLHHIDLNPVNTEWSLPQCFCIVSNGLAVQTQDEWIYTIRYAEMKAFIQAGIFHPSDFRDQDIADRAKADPFAKGFAILQSTWFLCNVIARWVSTLPVSPIEVSTVAYVVCGILTYAAYWHKPKNMSTSIKIYLRYTRATLPAGILRLTESNPKGWVHLRARIQNEGWLSLIWTAIKRPFLSTNGAATMITGDEEYNSNLAETLWKRVLFIFMVTFVASLFCAIHIAAWQFDFPSYVEQIAWRVSSLSSIALANIFSIGSSVFVYAVFLDSHGLLPPFMKGFTRPGSIHIRISSIIVMVSFQLYIIARIWMIALVFSSLRALPVGSYTTIEWVSTIPHFS